MHDARSAAVIVALALLAGCADAPTRVDDGATGPAPELTTVPDRTTAPSADSDPSSTTPLLRTGCRETQAQARADPDDFSGLPSGYGPTLDAFGQATLVFLHQDCDEGGTVWVFFLLDVPEAMLRADATHGGVVMAWSDDQTVLAAYKEWGFAFEAHAMAATTTDLGAIVTARIEGDPDFLFMVHGAGDLAPLPFGSLRLIDVNDGTVGATFDRDRPAITGREGPATASLLPEVGLNPASEHKAGLGSVSLDAVEASFNLVASDA